MFFNSLFFPLFSLLFSSHTHSLSHAHTLSLICSRCFPSFTSFTATLKRKKERAAFQLLFLTFSFLRDESSLKKCRRKKVVWTLLLRGERPKLLFDFDSRLLGFSRGTFEKNSSFSSKAQHRTTTTTTTTIEEKK